MQKINKIDITAVILAGGQGMRMNRQDKGLISFKGKPMVSHIISVVKNEVGQLLISANRNIEKYQQYGTVITDDLNDFQGPLAGITKALLVVKTPYLLVMPCDTPYISQSVIHRLITTISNSNADLCVASDGTRIHPTIAIIKTELKDNVSNFFDSGDRKLGLWVQQNNFVKADFSDCPEVLANLNTPEDFNFIPFIKST